MSSQQESVSPQTGGEGERKDAIQSLLGKIDYLRAELLTAADDLDKAANQFAGMTHLDIGAPVIVNNPDIFARKAERARRAAQA